MDAKLGGAGVGLEIWMDEPIHQKEWVKGETHGQGYVVENITMIDNVYLGYDKIGGRWGIALRTDSNRMVDEDDESVSQLANQEFELLRNADRASRILAFPHIQGSLEVHLVKTQQQDRDVEGRRGRQENHALIAYRNTRPSTVFDLRRA